MLPLLAALVPGAAELHAWSLGKRLWAAWNLLLDRSQPQGQWLADTLAPSLWPPCPMTHPKESLIFQVSAPTYQAAHPVSES